MGSNPKPYVRPGPTDPHPLPLQPQPFGTLRVGPFGASSSFAATSRSMKFSPSHSRIMASARRAPHGRPRAAYPPQVIGSLPRGRSALAERKKAQMGDRGAELGGVGGVTQNTHHGMLRGFTQKPALVRKVPRIALAAKAWHTEYRAAPEVERVYAKKIKHPERGNI